MADMDIGTLSGKLSMDNAQFNRALDDSRAKLASVEASVTQTSSTVAQSGNASKGAAAGHDELTASLGRIVTKAYLAHEAIHLVTGTAGALANALADAVKAGIAFEDQFADVRKAVDGDRQSMTDLSEDIRKLAQDIPITTKELSGIATAGGQLGIGAKDIKEFTTVVGELAKSSTLTAEAGATFFGQFSNVTKLDPSQFRNLASTMAILDKDGASTASTIADVALRIAGAGQAAGLSQPQILGWAAAVGNAGINSESGGTAISMFIRQVGMAVSEGGTKLADLAQVAGMTSDAFKNLFKSDANAALTAVLQGFNDLKAAGGDLGGVLEALHIHGSREIDDLTRLAGAQKSVGATVVQSTEAWRDQDAVFRIAAERFDTTANKITILSNVISGEAVVSTSGLGKMVGDLAKVTSDAIKADDDLYKKIGTDLSPAITDLTAALTPLVQSLAHELPGAVKGSLDVMLALGNAVAFVSEQVGKLPQPPEWMKTLYSAATNPLGFAVGNTVGGLQQAGEAERKASEEAEAQRKVQTQLDALHDVQQQDSPFAPKFEEFVYLTGPDGGRHPYTRTEADQIIRSSQTVNQQLMDDAEATDRAMFPRMNETKASPVQASLAAIAEGMEKMRAVAKEMSLEGSMGVDILADLRKELQTPLDSNALGLAISVQKLIDTMEKELRPERAAEIIQKLNAAMIEAEAAGNEELKKLTQERLAIVLMEANRAITVERPIEKKEEAAAEAARKKAEAEAESERKKAETKARQEAERLQREAERAAQQHADLLHDFERLSNEGVVANTPEIGKAAAAVGQALSNAMEPGAAGSQGGALARTVSDLINQAVKAGVPQAAETGEEIKAAMFAAISTGGAGERAAAQALVDNLGAQIKAQSALNPENFARAFETSVNRNTLGSEGAGLVAGLKKSATEGTPEALTQTTDALARLQGQLYGNNSLTPEQVQSYWDRIMASVSTAIETGGEDARAALEETLRNINVEQLLDVAGNVMNDRFKNASEQATRQIQQATDAADRSITEAISQLEQASANREQRANITRSQAEELKGPTRDIDTARLNRQMLREDQAQELQRRKQGADDERDYQRQLADIRRQASGTLDGVGTSSTGRISAEREAQLRAQGFGVGPVDNSLQKNLAEAKRLHEQKLADTKGQQEYEDNLKVLNRATAAADRKQDEAWAESLTQFKQRQADNLLAYEDQQAAIALHHRIDPGGTIDQEKDARIKAIQAQYTEQESRALEQFNKDLARQLLLRNVAPGGAGESATREQLTGQMNSYRAMLGLPALEGGASPFVSGGSAQPTNAPLGNIPEGSASAALQRHGLNPVTAGPTNIKYVYGSEYGVGRDAETINGETAAQEESQVATMGY